MNIRPMPAYFTIRISRKEQSAKQEKIGSILIPETQRFMMYNLQAGEILAIGDDCKKHFPEMQIGHTALIHHFVQGEDENAAREDHLIHQDEEYNYYVVTCFDFHRKGNETYGIWDGEKIIPNKEYIFLEVAKNDGPVSVDDFANSALQVGASGILTFSNWSETREAKADKMKRLKGEIEQLSKSGTQREHVKRGIMEKEAELQGLSLDINSRSYQPYKIAAFNPELKENFHPDANINIGETIYILNIAAQTEIEFQNKKYIVAKASYIAAAELI